MCVAYSSIHDALCQRIRYLCYSEHDSRSNFNKCSTTARWTVRRATVEFSNLEGQYRTRPSTWESMTTYERKVLGDQDRAAQDAAPPDKRTRRHIDKAAMFDGPAGPSQREGNSIQLREIDSRLKQRQYHSESWHERNVRETNERGFPLNKLTDELPTRQTVLILVITSVTQLMSQTLAIQGTWVPEATQVIFFVGEVQTMPHLPHGMHVIQLEGIDDKQAGWEVKVRSDPVSHRALPRSRGLVFVGW